MKEDPAYDTMIEDGCFLAFIVIICLIFIGVIVGIIWCLR